MSDHLPECECFGLSENAAWQTDCQCDRLRACEARVREEDADPPFRFSTRVECVHRFEVFDQIDGGQHAKCVLCGCKEPATQTSLSGPAAVLSSAPEPPTSVAPAGEDHGALRWVTEADYDRAIEDARLQGQRDEREAAARVVEERGGYHSASEFAAAIRTREEKP